jgi:hypothetical protein
VEEVGVDGQAGATAENPCEFGKRAWLVEPVESGCDGGQVSGRVPQQDPLSCCHQVAGPRLWLRSPQHRMRGVDGYDAIRQLKDRPGGQARPAGHIDSKPGMSDAQLPGGQAQGRAVIVGTRVRVAARDRVAVKRVAHRPPGGAWYC